MKFKELTLCSLCFSILSQLLVADVPTENPIASFYGDAQSYPAWIDRIQWSNAIDMSKYVMEGASEFEKFEAARDELANAGGGVLYYPAGDYDFSNAPMDGPDGRGLMLKSGVVIRGETPTTDGTATDGSLVLGTKFIFGFTERSGVSPTPAGQTPRDWNLIGLESRTASGEQLKDVSNVGIVNVHLVGASIFWGFQLDWDGTTSYANAGGWKSGLVKSAWAGRIANGQFPLDYFVGAGSDKTYLGAGSGRLVFGCVLQDSAPVNNVYREGRSDPKNFGNTGYFMQKFAGRIQVYGSNVFIANNLLPKSTRGFLYEQTVGDNPTQSTSASNWNNTVAKVYYNYNYTMGIDVNKEFLNPFQNKDAGYFKEHVIVRDNYVYNHGRKGYNLSGKWGEFRNNVNQRDGLFSTVPANSGPASGENYYLTLDGYVQVKPGGPGDISDTLSRAFDLGGGPLWVHGNKYGGIYGSTQSAGNDGEGILCQAHGGTTVYSWAVTYNFGKDGYMSGYDVTQAGALWGWNDTVGNTGSVKAGEMYDAAIVGNTGGTTAVTGSIPVLTSDPGNPESAPTDVSAIPVDDYVEVSWTDTSSKEAGFRIERSIDGGEWTVIAYRPRKEYGSLSNPQIWHDISAPSGRNLSYRVRPLNWSDDGVVVSEATDNVKIATNPSSRIAVHPDELIPQSASWEEGYQTRLEQLVNASTWGIGGGTGDTDTGKRDWPALLGEMYKVRDNDSALQAFIDGKGSELINSSYAGSFYKPFSVPGYNMYYFTFKDYSDTVGLSSSQENAARNINWSYLTREDNRMDPIYGQTEFNSENFNWMARLGGLQWAFELPDISLGNYQYNWQAGESKGMSREYFRNYMNNWVRALYNAGRVEWNSSIYWGYTFQPILTLFEYPPEDPQNADYEDKVRLQARAGADWMVLEAAIHYLDGFGGGPESRAKSSPQKPYNGSTWPYAYLYFIEDGEMPTYDVDEMLTHMSKNLVGWFPWSSYRPLNVLKSIAQRKFNLPVEIQSAKPFYHLDHDNYHSWAGEGSYAAWKAAKTVEEEANRTGFRYEFETIYMDTNYSLTSLASYRPNGDVGTFSEHNLFRLVVKGSDYGAIQVMGNTGFKSNPAGRDPYEQIGQYGNVVMRVLKNPLSTENKIWYGIPNTAARVTVGNNIFVDMGNGVYFALLPYGNPSLSETTYDGAHDKITYAYNANQLGAVVMEVGTSEDFGTFAAFQAAFSAANVSSPAANQLSYTSTEGKNLRMEWTGIVTDYPMTENGGYILQEGGIIPRTWRDGVEVDYNSWNAFETVQGDEVVYQEWGGGYLRLSAGGEIVEIEVDPATADVQYYKASVTPELPEVSIESVDTEGSETGSNALLFKLNRSGDTGSALEVKVGFSGEAESNDYVITPKATNGKFTIGAGQSSLEILVMPIDDGIEEPQESVHVEVETSPEYRRKSPTIGTGFIMASGSISTAFEEWQSQHFTTAEIESGLGGPESDAELPIGDGLVNLLEFAFKLDPKVNDAVHAFEAIEVTKEGGEMLFKLKTRRNPEASELLYALEVIRPEISMVGTIENPEWEGFVGTDSDGTPIYEYHISTGADSILCRVRVSND